MSFTASMPLSVGLSVTRYLTGPDHDILINHDNQSLYHDGRYVRLLRRLLQMEKGLRSLCLVFESKDPNQSKESTLKELGTYHENAAAALLKLIIRNQSVPSVGSLKFASLSFGFQMMLSAARQGRIVNDQQLRRVGLATLNSYEGNLCAKYEYILEISPRLDHPILKCLAEQHVKLFETYSAGK